MSKEKILAAIRNNKPVEVALPTIPVLTDDRDPLLLFQQSLETGNSRFVQVAGLEEVNAWVATHFPDAVKIAAPIAGIRNNVDLNNIQSPHELESVDLAILNGQLGVAENGAVWLTELEAVHRVLPFITQHLILLLPSNAIVHTMHQAYQRIQIDATGFGVFIAGPSKTADIEQALVIGAQAARSLTVIVIAEAVS